MTLLVERIRDDADEPDRNNVALTFAPEDSMLFAGMTDLAEKRPDRRGHTDEGRGLGEGSAFCGPDPDRVLVCDADPCCCCCWGFLAPLLLVVLYSFMPRGTFSPFGFADARKLYRHRRAELPYLVRMVAAAGADSRPLMLLVIAYPLAVGNQAGGPQARTDPDGFDRRPAVRCREHPPAGLGAVPRQGRRAGWQV